MQVLKSLWIAGCASLMLIACNEDESALIALEKPITIQATIACPEGCTAIWSEGDQFGLWSRTAYFADNNVPFTLSGNPESGQFHGKVSAAEGEVLHSLRGCYTYQANRGFDPTYLAVQIPAHQSQQGALCQLNRYGFLTARADQVDLSTGNTTLQFSTPCAIIRILLDAAGTDAVSKRATQLTLQSSDPIVGNLVYNLEEERIEIPAAGRAVTLTLEDRPTLDQVRPFYIVAQPGELNQSTLTLSIQCEDKSTIDLSLNYSSVLTAGEVSEVSIPLAQLIASGDAEFNEFRYDLGKNGTANCYIVTHADKYKFRPTMGNSSDEPKGIVRADWLWMTEEGLISNVKYGKGGITFDAGEGRGNALIAAFNEAGEIVWSWHIWLTDDPTINAHVGAATQYVLMDRNLGATSTTPFDVNSLGLYYQWGRKDPFLGQRNTGSSTRFQEATAFSEITYAHIVNGDYAFTTTTNEMVGTTKASAIDYVTKHPMTFVTATITTNGQSWWNSAYTDYETLWGSGGKKAIYDPCPPGYRVPRTEYSFGVDITSSWDVKTEEVNESRVRYCFGYWGPAGGPVRSYYPAAGFRYQNKATHASSGTSAEGGSMGYTGAVGYYWSNMLRPKSNNVWVMELDPAGGIFHGSRRNNGHSARGGSIRCERE